MLREVAGALPEAEEVVVVDDLLGPPDWMESSLSLEKAKVYKRMCLGSIVQHEWYHMLANTWQIDLLVLAALCRARLTNQFVCVGCGVVVFIWLALGWEHNVFKGVHTDILGHVKICLHTLWQYSFRCLVYFASFSLTCQTLSTIRTFQPLIHIEPSCS